MNMSSVRTHKGALQPPVVAESAIDEVAALSAPENIQYFYIILKKAFLKY